MLLHISWSFIQSVCFQWNQLLFAVVIFFVFLDSKHAYFWHYSSWWWTNCQSTFCCCMYWFLFNIVIFQRCISSQGSKFPIAFSMISSFLFLTGSGFRFFFFRVDSTVLHLSSVQSTKETILPSGLPLPKCKTQHESSKKLTITTSTIWTQRRRWFHRLTL